MSRTPREAFETGTATFNAHDIDGFTQVLADDVEFTAPGDVRGKGKDACAAFFASWFDAFPDAHVDVHAAHFAGDVVVEEGTFSGTHTGVLRGGMGDVPPTGRRVEVALVAIVRFRDGKLAHEHIYWDQACVLKQIGLLNDPSLPVVGAESARKVAEASAKP